MALKSETVNLEIQVESLQMKQFKHSTVYRDLFIWIFCILILPLVILSVYCLIKFPTNATQSNIFTENKTNETENDFNLFYNKVTDYDENELNEDFFKFENQSNDLMIKVPLKSSLCNDGSPANYYIRNTNKSKTWIIQLEGGFFCYDKNTCKQRFRNSFNLTSSKTNREFKIGKGILSASDIENKYWFDANLVNIPYCSSDLWIGSKRSESRSEFNFLGSNIIEEVFDDLLTSYEMNKSELVIVAGISAGGIGVILNSNKIKSKLDKEAPNAELKAIIDSTWLIDLPYSYLCNNNNEEDCLIKKILNDSIKYWNASLECNSSSIIECFLPEIIVSKMKIPVFVVQNLFDETQLIEQYKAISIRDQSTQLETFLRTISLLNLRLSKSLNQLNSYFVPACIQHMIINRSDWNTFQIDNVSLDDSIYCWSLNNESNCNKTKMLEKCSYPNCNLKCPRVNHPDTDKTINLTEYFNYFGMINYDEIAIKLKQNIINIKKMSYKKLMKLLSENLIGIF